MDKRLTGKWRVQKERIDAYTSHWIYSGKELLGFTYDNDTAQHIVDLHNKHIEQQHYLNEVKNTKLS